MKSNKSTSVLRKVVASKVVASKKENKNNIYVSPTLSSFTKYLLQSTDYSKEIKLNRATKK